MATYGLYKIGTKTVTISGTIEGDVSAVLTYHGGANLKSAKFPQSPLTKFVRSIRNAPLSTARATMSGNIEYGSILQADWEVVCLETGSSATTTKTTTREINLTVLGSSTSFSDSRYEISSQALSGTFSLEIPCDICINTTQPQTGTGDLAPFWNRIEDTPQATNLEILLYPVPSTNITGTLVIAGRTLTVTVSTGTNPGRLYYSIESTCTGEVFCDSHTPMSALAEADQTISVTNFLPLSSISGLSSSSAVSQASATSSTSAGVSSLQLACNGLNVSADTSSASGSAARTESGDRSAKMQCELYYMDDPKQVLPNGDNLGGYLGGLSADLVGMGTTPISFGYPYTPPGSTPTTGMRFERSNTQKLCDQSVSTVAEDASGSESDSDTDSVNTYSAISAAIREDSLVSVGDDPNARRLMIRGKGYLAASIELAETFLIDDCTDLTVTSGDYAGSWTISSGGSISIETATFSGVSADIIRFSGAGKVVTRSFDTDSYLSNYRFLRLYIRADAASKTLTVAINGKEWTATTSSTANQWTYYYIDLDLPPNKTEDKDGTDTRWPETSAGLPSEGVYFGIGTTTEITISGMASGVLYEIADVSLSLNPALITVDGVTLPMYFSDLDFIQSLGYWVQEKPDVVVSEAGTTTQFFTSRFFYMRTDQTGNAADEPAFKKQVTTGGVSGVTVVVYTHKSILGLLDRLSNKRYPGFTITDERPAPTASGAVHPPADYEYYNSDLPAVYLCGGGLMPAVVADSQLDAYFSVASNLEVTPIGNQEYNAYPLYDSISDWYPGCGNVFGYSDYETVSGRLLLRLGSILRGAGHGIVAKANHTGSPNVTVDLYQSGINRGYGVSDNRVGINPPYGTEGLYYTHDPYSQLGASTLETQDQSIAFTAYTRKRQRGIFVADLGGRIIAMGCSATQRVVRAISNGSSVLLLEFWRWAGVGVGAWDRVETTLTLIGAGALCYDTQSSSQRLWLVYEDTSTTIKSRYTDDEGGTWSVATTITSAGTFPAIALSPTGVTHYFWVDGSAIKSAIYDSQANVLTAAFSAVASGVASAAIDAIHDGTVIYLTYKNTTGSGQVVTVKSTDGGITYS